MLAQLLHNFVFNCFRYWICLDDESASRNDGRRLHVYKREVSRYWQCATFINGSQPSRPRPRKTVSPQAKDFAEDWYLDSPGQTPRRRAQARSREREKFELAADQFLGSIPALTEGERNPIYVAGHRRRLDNAFASLLRDKWASPEITPAWFRNTGSIAMKRQVKVDMENAPPETPPPGNGGSPPGLKPPSATAGSIHA